MFVVSSELEADPEDEAPEIDDEEVELKEKWQILDKISRGFFRIFYLQQL